MQQQPHPHQIQPAPSSLAIELTQRVLMCAIEQIQRSDGVQQRIKDMVVAPVIAMLYKELRPYIIALGTAVILILVFSVLTFVLFLLSKLKHHAAAAAS
jgi:hypothetical protein